MPRNAPRFLAAAALVIAALAIALILGVRASGEYTLNAVFEQANGLVEGGEVQAAGIKVGSVERIELGSDGLPHVRMRVAGDYRMRRGGRATIRFFSVSGEVNRYVELLQGSGAQLPGGATIVSAQTEQPVEIDQVLATLDPGTRRDVHTLLRRLDETTKGRGAAIEQTLRFSARSLRETASLLDELRGDGRALRTVLRDGRTVVGALAADPGALGATADELAGLLSTTAARQRELALATARLPAGLRSPRLALDRTRASVGRLRGLVADARPGVAALVPFARDLRPTLAAAVPALAQARALVRDAPAQLRSLDVLLKSAPPVLAQLDPVLRTANPMLDEVRARLPDAFGFFANWADFASNYDANGHAARIGLVFPPAPANAIGPSDARPGNLKRPFLRTPGVLEGEPWKDYRDSFVAGSTP